MDDFFQVICSSILFGGIAPDDVRTMLSCLGARRAHYDKNAYVLSAGERTGAVGLVLSGRALIVREDFWGNRSILAEAAPGELYAESFACSLEPLTVNVVAAEALTVMQLDFDRLIHMCSATCTFHSALLNNLMKVLARKNLRLTGKLMHMERRTTREKLLSYLSECSQAAGSPEFAIPFDRQQLADYLSVDRSAMSAELSRMRGEGIVSYNKNRFTLTRPEPA